MGLFDFAKNSSGDVPSGFGGRGDIANHLTERPMKRLRLKAMA